MLLNLPDKTFNYGGARKSFKEPVGEDRDDHRHEIGLDPIRATAELIKIIKDRTASFLKLATPDVLQNIIEFLDDSANIDFNQQFNSAVDYISDEVVKLIEKSTGTSLQSNQSLLPYVVQGYFPINGDCKNFDGVSIECTDQYFNGDSASFDIEILEGILKLNIRLVPSFTGGETITRECTNLKQVNELRKKWEKYNERVNEYNKRMAEWREALRVYHSDPFNEPFPYAPTDLPDPYSFQEPPHPDIGKNKRRRFFVKWNIEFEGMIAMFGGKNTFLLQEGQFWIGTTCCLKNMESDAYSNIYMEQD